MKYILLLPALMLAACTPVASTLPATPPSGADTCGAAAYATLIGKDAPNALIVPQPKRVYRLGDPVTMDFNPARVNVELNEMDVIVAVKCG